MGARFPCGEMNVVAVVRATRLCGLGARGGESTARGRGSCAEPEHVDAASEEPWRRVPGVSPPPCPHPQCVQNRACGYCRPPGASGCGGRSQAWLASPGALEAQGPAGHIGCRGGRGCRSSGCEPSALLMTPEGCPGASGAAAVPRRWRDLRFSQSSRNPFLELAASPRPFLRLLF